MIRLFLFLLLFFPFVVFAVLPDEVLSDGRLEGEAREISRLLRCVVCDNQTIDDSPSDLAKEMRLLVRRRLLAGDSKGQVLDYMRRRYGDDVVLLPLYGWGSFILWASTPIVLLGGGLCLYFYYRRRNHARRENEQK